LTSTWTGEDDDRQDEDNDEENEDHNGGASLRTLVGDALAIGSAHRCVRSLLGDADEVTFDMDALVSAVLLDSCTLEGIGVTNPVTLAGFLVSTAHADDTNALAFAFALISMTVQVAAR